MPRLSSLILVQLNGEVPAELNLPTLQSLSATCNVIRTAFLPYLDSDALVASVSNFEELEALRPKDGVVAIYLVGHAWANGPDYNCSIRDGSTTRFLSASDLANILLRKIPPSSPLLLLIDTCNAEGLLQEIKAARSGASTCVLMASLAGQITLEYPLDKTTRFAAALSASLKAPSRDVDAVELAIAVRKKLSEPGIMPAQASSYWIAGDAIHLEPTVSPLRGRPQRPFKTYLLLRSILIATGVAVAAVAVWAFIYYRTHVLVTIDVPDLADIANSASIEIDRVIPEENKSDPIYETQALNIRTLQVRLPASDLLIIPKVQFKDGSPREMRVHLNLKPGLRWSGKKIHVTLPTDAEIVNHPGMAYIPVSEWEQGSDRQRSVLSKPFWIDLKPLSVREYRPFAVEAERNGDIVYSVLLNAERNSAAIQATGARQVPKLMGDLNKIFNIIDSSKRAEAAQKRSAGHETTNTQVLTDVPCDSCPVPLTMEEARNFCEKHGKRVPTDLEWELAARGVDGRLYPWGNKFDGSKTNCVGLPDKGQPPATLQPSDKYLSGMSPFGLIDMVGNAGDWVDTQGGYERTYMGGFYAFNPEECMVFKSLPDTGEPPWRKITVRCAQD